MPTLRTIQKMGAMAAERFQRHVGAVQQGYTGNLARDISLFPSDDAQVQA